MKVLVLPSFYPTNDDLNRGIFFQEQGNLCVTRDTTIDILYHEQRSLKKLKNTASWVNHFQISKSYENNVFVFRRHSWNLLPTHTRIGQKLWIRFTLGLFRKYVQKRGLPDIIHVQSTFFAGEVADIIYHKYKVPFIIQEHGTFVATHNFSDAEIVHYKRILRNARQVLTVSKPLKELLVQKFDLPVQSVKILPNFIDTDFFSSDSVTGSPVKKPSGFLFLAVSYLSPQKKLDRLVCCFEKAFKGDPNVFLYIGGKGTERKNIQALIERLGIGSQVRLLGELNRLQVREYMAICDSFVLASDVETFGVVLIEAMAMGKPVVATRSGGPEDIVNGDVGILTNPEQDDITNALLKMYREISNYDHLLIKKHVLDNFSKVSTAKELTQLYETV